MQDLGRSSLPSPLEKKKSSPESVRCGAEEKESGSIAHLLPGHQSRLSSRPRQDGTRKRRNYH